MLTYSKCIMQSVLTSHDFKLDRMRRHIILKRHLSNLSTMAARWQILRVNDIFEIYVLRYVEAPHDIPC